MKNKLTNTQAEKYVLGCLLGGADIGDLTVDHFHLSESKVLFRLIKDMIEQSIPIEVTSVCVRAMEKNLADTIGGISNITSIFNQAPLIGNIDYYTNILVDCYTKRKLLLALETIKANTLSTTDDSGGILGYAENILNNITKSSSKSSFEEVDALVDEQIDRIEKLKNSTSSVSGIPTGFDEIDSILAGVHPTDLLIIAARPAMGKTAFALNLALNISRQGEGVAFFSLEMAKGQLITRLLCTESRIDAGKVRNGDLSDAEMHTLKQTREHINRLPIYIEDTSGLNITQVREKARTLCQKNPEISVIMVDYIGLMSGERGVDRHEQVSTSSRGLKALAKELNVCVIALSQLNRGVEKRADKRPVQSDLRDSGAIEQDADVIGFIYRDEYYNPETKEPDVAELIIAKQRNGATGTAKLYFNGNTTRFDNFGTL